MDWIRVNTALPSHPKVRKLARRLGVSRHEAVGIVLDLFAWTATTRERGDLNGMDDEDLAVACDVQFEPEKFVHALVACAILDRSESGLNVHDWLEYQGPMLDARERKRTYRSRLGDGTGTGQGRDRDATGRPPPTTYHQPPTKTRTHERDRLPAGGGPVARTYREWEPPA